MKKVLPVIIFLGALAYFTILCAPDMTWSGTDADGLTYLTAAKYHMLSHPVGAPLFNLLNWGVIKIPLGTEFWRLAMVSTVSSAIACTLLYLIAQRYSPDWKAILAPLAYAASGLVVSQSIIVETYSLATMLMVAVYYLHVTQHHHWKYMVCGVGLAVHPIMLFVAIPLLLSDWWNSKKAEDRLYNLRLTVRNICLILPLLLFYLYVPILNRAPFLWTHGTAIRNYYYYFFGQSGLTGGLAVFPADDLLERVVEISILLLGGFLVGLCVIIPAVVRDFRDKQYLLAVLFLTPVVYYAINISPQTYVYTMPAFAFGGILLVKYIAYRVSDKTLVSSIVGISLLVGLFLNLQLYDVGRSYDPNLEATSFYRSLDNLPADAVVWSQWRGWEKVAIRYHNLEEGTNIDPIEFGGDREMQVDEIRASCMEAARADRMYITSLQYDTDEVRDMENKGVTLHKVGEAELQWIFDNDKYWEQMEKRREGKV